MRICNCFQSTRPHGARFAAFAEGTRNFVFQSTRPHGARRILDFDWDQGEEFQIHAPARARLTEVLTNS